MFSRGNSGLCEVFAADGVLGGVETEGILAWKCFRGVFCPPPPDVCCVPGKGHGFGLGVVSGKWFCGIVFTWKLFLVYLFCGFFRTYVSILQVFQYLSGPGRDARFGRAAAGPPMASKNRVPDAYKSERHYYYGPVFGKAEGHLYETVIICPDQQAGNYHQNSPEELS